MQDASELDLVPRGTGSMLILFPLLPIDEDGLVTVRLESGLEPNSVDLSSSGSSMSCSACWRDMGGKSRSSSPPETSLALLGGVFSIASKLFIGELAT